MMEQIITWISTSLPASVSVVIAIACLAGYYYFVIPMIEDLKNLKEENRILNETLREHDAENFLVLFKHMSELQVLLEEIKTSTENIDDPSNARKLDVVLERIAEHRREIEWGSWQEVSTTLRDINDKQNQIIGALLGMSSIDRNHRGI